MQVDMYMYVLRWVGCACSEQVLITCVCRAGNFGGCSGHSSLPWIRRTRRQGVCGEQGIHGNGLYEYNKKSTRRHGVLWSQGRYAAWLYLCLCV